MKTLPYWATLCLFITACDSSQPSSRTDSLVTDTTAKNLSNLKLDTTEKLPNWDYDTTEDAMTSRKTIIASTEATNSFEFNAPYDGYNDAKLVVRKKRGTVDIYLKIDKGQFITGVYGTNIKVRFDDHHYSEYSCNRSSDYDPTILFIYNVDSFISRLRKAKKIIIEANIYNNGNQQFEFMVDGFKWGAYKSQNVTYF